jgi:hypothetical protein
MTLASQWRFGVALTLQCSKRKTYKEKGGRRRRRRKEGEKE